MRHFHTKIYEKTKQQLFFFTKQIKLKVKYDKKKKKKENNQHNAF